MSTQSGFRRRAVLLQSIPEYAEVVFDILREKGELRGDANTAEFRATLTWIVEQELQAIGLVVPTHIKNQAPYSSYHQVVAQYFWDVVNCSFSSFTAGSIRSPVVYGDDSVQVAFDGHDLTLTYYTQTVPPEFKARGVRL